MCVSLCVWMFESVCACVHKECLPPPQSPAPSPPSGGVERCGPELHLSEGDGEVLSFPGRPDDSLTHTHTHHVM